LGFALRLLRRIRALDLLEASCALCGGQFRLGDAAGLAQPLLERLDVRLGQGIAGFGPHFEAISQRLAVEVIADCLGRALPVGDSIDYTRGARHNVASSEDSFARGRHR